MSYTCAACARSVSGSPTREPPTCNECHGDGRPARRRTVGGRGFDRVYRTVYQGSRLPFEVLGDPSFQRDFDVAVFTAMEHQPPRGPRGWRKGGVSFVGDPMTRVELVRCPMDDAELTPSELELARGTAKQLAVDVEMGRRVLVTCQAGLNRSGLVVALTLQALGASPDRALSLVRRARGPSALSNPSFLRALGVDARLYRIEDCAGHLRAGGER